jgi:SAM-dependent methyltransferase
MHGRANRRWPSDAWRRHLASRSRGRRNDGTDPSWLVAVYADVDDPPDDLGMFEIAIFGDALSRLASPYRALQRIARYVTDSIVLVLENEPSGPPLDVSGHSTTVVFVPGAGSGGSPLWHHTPAALGRMLMTCGFTEQSWGVFTPPSLSTYAALVARKARKGHSVQVSKDTIQERPLAEAPSPSSVDTAGLDAAEKLPLPPPRLRHLVAGTEDLEVFVTLGRAGFRAIRATLARAGISDASIGRVLDFGCGVGRVMRYWITCPSIEMHGTDLNPDAIAWDRENLSFVHVTTNGLEPSLAYSDGQFDLVYVLSVFTHLPESSQIPWLNELARIVRPDGHIYFTTHGVSYRHVLSPAQQLQFDRGELVTGGSDPGSNLFGAFHPLSYVRRTMLPPCGLTLVEFQPEGAAGNPVQDSWLVRKA